MKRIIKSYVLAVIAVAALFSCQEKLTEKSPESGKTHRVSFVTDIDDVTKTTMEIEEGVARFSWAEADKNNIRVFENDVKCIVAPGDVTIGEDGKLSFSAEFETTKVPSYSYRAVIAAAFAESSEDPMVKASQNISGSSYCSDADILVARPILNQTTTQEGAFSLKYTRPVAISKMTLKNLENGEVFKSLKVSSDKPIVKTLTLNKSTEDPFTWSETGTNAITITPEEGLETPIAADASGNLVISFITAPVEDATFTVFLTTNKHVYKKTFAKTINLAANSVNSYKVDLSTAEKIKLGWVETTQSKLKDGDVFVYVSTKSSNSYAISNDNGASNPTVVSVTISGSMISSTVSDNCKWIFSSETGGFSFCKYDDKSKKLYSAGKTSVKVGSGENYIFTLDGSLLKNIGTNRYLGVYNNTDWRCYANASDFDGQSFAFYVFNDGKKAQTLAFSETQIEGNLVDGVIEPILTKEVFKPVVFTSSEESVATVDQEGHLTLVGEGTTTISASVSGDEEYRSASASYTLKLIKKPLVEPEITLTTNEVNDNITVSWKGDEASASYTVSYVGPEEITDAVELEANVKEYTFSDLGYGKYTVTVKSNAAAGYAEASASDEITLVNTTPQFGELKDILIKGYEEKSSSFNIEYFNMAKSDISVAIYSDEACTISDVDWLSANISDTEDKIEYEVQENNTNTTKEAWIKITGKTPAVSKVKVTHYGIEQLTISEFINKTVDSEIWYELTGVINNLTNADYGNFDLTDNTSTVYVYGLTKTKSEKNDKSFSELDLIAGDKVTIVTHRAEHSGTAQAGGTPPAFHKASEHAPRITASDISKIDGDGIANAKAGVSLKYFDGWTKTITCDGTVVTTASWSESDKDVLYTVGENTTSDSRNGSITITLSKSGWTDVVKTIKVTQNKKGAVINPIVLDLTTKTIGHSNYSDSWTYGDWTITNGSNNNKGWGYVKMGGKKTTISTANPCSIGYKNEVTNQISEISVHLPAGSLSNSGMSVNSWGVYIYSDSKMTTQIDYVSGGTITKSDSTFSFKPSTGKTWKNCYVKVSWDLANTSDTNGIVCVDNISIIF